MDELEKYLGPTIRVEETWEESHRTVEELRWLTALHQAGHAAVAWKGGYGSRLTSLSIEKDGTGSTTIRPEFKFGVQQRSKSLGPYVTIPEFGRLANFRKLVWHGLKKMPLWLKRGSASIEARVWLAGPMAEQWFLPEFAQHLVLEGDHYCVPREWMGDVRRAAWTLWLFYDDADVVSQLRKCRDSALKQLARDRMWSAVEDLARTLLEEEFVTHQRVVDIMEEHFPPPEPDDEEHYDGTDWDADNEQDMGYEQQEPEPEASTEKGVYRELKAGLRRRGGRMEYRRAGSPHGTWTVTCKGKSRRFRSSGRGFPELDRLYVPNRPNPTHWKHYSGELVPGAIDKLIRMLR